MVEGGGGATAKGRWLRRAPLWIVAVAPGVLALVEALRSPRLNYLDYWVMVSATTTPDGTLDVAKLFHLYNEHPAVLAGLVFWLDARWFEGTNPALGVLSVLLAAGMLVALWSMIPARLGGTKRLAVGAALSVLVFSSAATEYFGNGMMGAQWLLGLAPSVAALAFAHHGKTVPALVFAVLGSFGHGSAFGVWLALALVAWLRRDRVWRVVLPLLLGAGVFTWWQLAPWPAQYPQAGITGPDSYLGAMLTTLGQVWSLGDVDLSLVAGALTVVALLALVGLAVRHRVEEPVAPSAGEDAGWFGLALHMLIAAAMIGISRGGLSYTGGLAPRYAAIGLLGAAALLVLGVLRGPAVLRARAVVVALAVALVTYAVGGTAASEIRTNYADQPTLAVAMLVGADSVIQKLYGYPAGVPLARTMGIYPFSNDYTLGCGGPELGTRLDPRRAVDLPAPKAERPTAGIVESGPVTGDTVIEGWAMIDHEQPDCVLVADGTGTVVGGGTVGLPRQDVRQVVAGSGRTGWRAVARPGIEGGQIFVVHKGKLYRIVTSQPH